MLSVFQSEDEKAKDSKQEIVELVAEASRIFKRALLVRKTANNIFIGFYKFKKFGNTLKHTELKYAAENSITVIKF